MADVTISGLTPGTPSTSAVLPYSQSGVTNSTTVANIGTALGLGGTGGLTLPVGTTAQRPINPATGTIRFNTTTNRLEFYNGSAWRAVESVFADPLTIEYLIIGGGAAGAYPAGNSSGGRTGTSGGSGIVIIAYQGTQRATGGSVNTSSRAGYTVHTFTGDGTFTVT